MTFMNRKSCVGLFFVLLMGIYTPTMAAPILYKDASSPEKIFSVSSLPAPVNQMVRDVESKRKDIYKIVVYKFQNYYVLYLLSSKYWETTKIRVDVTATGTVSNVTDSYQGNEAESKALLKGLNSSDSCPDPAVQFVAISPVPELGNVRQAIDEVYQAASKKYKAVKILGDDANAKAYAAWLSCPNLKGFYSVGHGDNMELMVANGETVPYIIFHDMRYTYKYLNNQTILIFNSCEVFNHPFGSEITFGNAYSATDYEINPGPLPALFMAGYTRILVGPSELTSACFITKGLAGDKMDFSTLKSCVGGRDFYYRGFGMSYPSQYIDEDSPSTR